MHESLPITLSLIAFPGIDPVLIQFGPLAIHWYGLAYVAGILFAWWYTKRIASTPRLWAGSASPIATTDLDDFLVWAAVGVVLGGRTGYVLFYDLPRFVDNPLQIFALWNGGMSFHGGAAGTILAMVLFARSRRIPAWSLLDTVAAAVPIGLLLGRLANFINAELWGRPASVPWAMIFPTDALGLPRHPSQLYEAFLEGLVLFAILAWLVWAAGKLKRPKFVGGAFVSGYGLARIAVEFFREPDAHIGYLWGGWLTMGMILSLPMVLAGAWAMLTAKPAAIATGQ